METPPEVRPVDRAWLTLPWIAAAAAVLLPLGAALYVNFHQSTSTATVVSSSPSPDPSPSPSAAPVSTPSPSPSAFPSPIPTASPFLDVEIVSSTDYGYLSAYAPVGASCNAQVVLPNGDNAKGVRNPQVSGEDALVQWLYPQPPTDEGTGHTVVTCSLNGLMGTATSTFEVGS